MKVIQNKLNKTKLVAGIAAILLFATIYNICKIPTSATAESNTSTYGLTATSESSLEISLVTPESPLSIKPTGGDGTFNSEQITVKVGTNNTTGYKLTMSADTTSLSRSPAGSGSIPTLESAVTEADFPVNHWGFMRTTDNNTFQPMKAGEAIYINATGIQNDIAESAAINNITFGVKLNNAIPMGNYSISLNFVATTNPVPMTMQDVTSSILAEYMPNIGDTYALRDSRDGKDYKVAKLREGEYYMVQNLAFTGTNLYKSSSDVQQDMTIIYYDLATNKTECFPSNTPANTPPCIHSSDAYGVWYSYYAATAGSYDYNASATSGQSTLCPAGWTIPRIGQLVGLGEGFNNITGGYYGVDGPQATFVAQYWSKNNMNNGMHYVGQGDHGNGSAIIEKGSGNQVGNYIRCIFSGE